MQLHEINFGDAVPVDGYGPGFFRVAGEVHEGPTLVVPGQVASWGGYADVDFLTGLAGQIDVLFVGTGVDVAHVPTEFRAALESVGLGVEAMASPAAARTYNVLLSEGRRIALAMLPV